MKTTLALAALLAGLLTLLGVAAAAAPPKQVSDLLRMTVVDGKNKRLGVLTDLVVDLDKGQIVGIQVGHSTADGMVHDVFALAGVQWRDDKVVVSGGAIGQEVSDMQSIAKMIHAPLKDAQGKNAGEIADFLVSLDDASVASIVIQFDPKWLDMAALAALPLSSVQRKEDGFVAKFSSSEVRPDQPSGAVAAAPPPPPPAPRARLTQLAGSTIVDLNGKTVAIIDDAMIDTNAKRLACLVVHADGGQPVTVALPQPGLHFDNGKLIANAGLNGLASTSAANLSNVRRMLDTRMVNPSGDPVGRIEDVVVDMASGTLQFVVASFDPTWVAAGWVVAFPVRPIAPDAKGQPTMKAQLGDINRSFIFESKSWPDITNPAVRDAIHARIDRM
jgi:sporulation protein YlmC with PRC-barrel domain